MVEPHNLSPWKKSKKGTDKDIARSPMTYSGSDELEESHPAYKYINYNSLLVCGDAEGNFKTLFQRVSKVSNATGPYDALFCVGEFFGEDRSQWDDLRSGNIKITIPTYILGPLKAEMKTFFPDIKGCELMKNMIYLGDSGVFTGASGEKIAYMSGLENNHYGGLSLAYDSIKAIEVLLGGDAGFRGVDILFTSQWPKSITNFASVPPGFEPEASGSPLVSRLALKVKPRYHFAGVEDIFYQRLPYRNHRVLAESQKHVTRFIGVAKVGNKSQKWLYAFNLTPMCKMDNSTLVEQPTDATESPYINDEKIVNVGLPTKPELNQFFYDTNYQPGEAGQQKKKRKYEENRPPGPPSPCWFCLSSPDVDKHLIISIGEHELKLVVVWRKIANALGNANERDPIKRSLVQKDNSIVFYNLPFSFLLNAKIDNSVTDH
ncbi:hypothetical protein QYM36_001043 [Artemia franciscana]|uniref:Cwf19-like C-terminal domain-containing protein n=1 Tax=Artemia franciscana TaxID=6661 RepID=A0AA88I5B6_ARTSF|nr:hypothetical protein QYM36_001043 [Artemia franciscana]